MIFQSAPGLIRQAKPAGGSKPADWPRPEGRGYREDNDVRRRCLRQSFPLKGEVSNEVF